MGRPKEFDRNEVLERALALFLRKGYECTSIRDLVNATGVNRFSLYESFGDKHKLFLSALDLYHAQRQATVQALFAGSGPKLPSLRRYFEMIIEDGLRPNRPGCLMLNSTIELARTDAEVARRAARHFSRLEDLFVEALETAERQGELRLDRDSHSIARFLLNHARGLRVVVQYTQDRYVVEDVLATLWSMLLTNQANGTLEFQNVRSENRTVAAN